MMSQFKRSIYRVFVLLSYVLCVYLYDKFSLGDTDALIAIFSFSACCALVSIVWRTYYIADDYPGFFTSTLMIDAFTVFFMVLTSDITSWITIGVYFYVLYFPSAYACYFILQRYEVKRSGGH